MTWPVIFGTLLGGDQPLSLFDGMFNQTAAMIQIPCSASGNNAVSLTPLINCPVLTSYNELGGYRFRANGNSSAAVTAQFNGLGFLPVYHADGATQANVGDLVSGQEYVLIYSTTLAGGFPGFFLEQPAVGGGSTGLGGTPGGRLTLTNSSPVMPASVNGTSIVYYAPYVNQFIPIWNGSTLQQYSFCSSLADQVGLGVDTTSSGNFPAGVAFDVFITLVGGVPVMAFVAWTNPVLRASPIAIFGGMLTNGTTVSMRTGPSTVISVTSNQGTFVGTVIMNGGGNGLMSFVYGTAASGGGAASFGICNYYNKVLHNTIVIDNGSPYTYSTATARQARASAGNQISYIQSDSERAASFYYDADSSLTANVGSFIINGLSTISTAFATNVFFTNPSSTSIPGAYSSVYQVSSAGLTTIFAVEQGDGTHANTFDGSSGNILGGSIWL